MVLERGNGFDRSSDNHLAGRVVVGDHDAHASRRDLRLDLRPRCRDRDHRARHGRCFRHQLATPARDMQEVVGADDAGRVQRADLAETVAGDHLRHDSYAAEHGEHRERHGAERGLCPFGARERRRCRVAFLVGKDRARKDDLVQRQRRIERKIGRAIPHCLRRLVEHRERAAHTQVLATLSGEQEGDRPLARAISGYDARFGDVGIRRRIQALRGSHQPCGQFFAVRGDHCHAATSRHIESLLGGVGEPFKHPWLSRIVGHRPAGLGGATRISGAHHNERRAFRPDLSRPAPAPHILLDSQVEICAAKPGRAQTATAWVARPACPWARLCV